GPAYTGRVLVMDDDRDVRESLVHMLASFGVAVEGVADGRAAVDEYVAAQRRREGYDLVFMDLTVPGGVGGREAVRLLLENDPTARVIVVSGYSHDPVLADCRRFGFRGGLAKPVAMDDLGRLLAEFLAPADA
ncbi:response regulator, partial [bacterium]|nr:response regulator [bacterium]